MVRYYTPIKEGEFEKNTCNKKEFKKYVYNLKYNKTSLTKYALLPHQQFLANYINPKTPYKGMLIYHETGTGKTCTAISIAENFKEDLKKRNKKCIILCTDTVKDEFYRTISSPDSSSFKCTGDTYTESDDFNESQKDLNKRIDQYYTFYTYQKFGKEFFGKDFKKEFIDETKKNEIKKAYSNSFIIVDEAHNLRGKVETSDTSFLTHRAIDLISTYAENVKILFLTATPMFDTPIEIIWILNVLIRVNNDTIDELNEQEIFNISNDGYSITDVGKEKLIRAFKGKVSYLKTGNPNTFPLKLFEETQNFKYTPSHDYNGHKLMEKDTIYNDFFKLTLSPISDSHYDIISKAQNDQKQDKFHMLMMQLHNVSWYSQNNSLISDGGFKGGGLQKHFDITDHGVYTPKTPNVLRQLATYAPKINNIVNQILEMSSNGIAFVFSQFIPAGIIPIILALEDNGFSKYKKNASFNHLKNRKSSVDRGKYIVMTSSPIFNSKKDYFNIARSSENANGNLIRVIIVSKTGGEGLDLKYIRQVHILEPHFHFSHIEQAVGRAIRNNSHRELPLEKRNCTIYYHSTIYPEANDKETVDMLLYKIAFKKRIASNQVRELIEANSITCKFFEKVNSFDWNAIIDQTIENSKGKSIKISKETIDDYKKNISCNTCLCLNSSVSDDDTYNPLVHSKWQVYVSMKIIFDLFKKYNTFSLHEITDYIHEINEEIDDETIYFALNIIVNSDENTENKFNIQGKIRKLKNYYEFVPNYSLYTGIYNDVPLKLSNSIFSLGNISWPKRPSPDIEINNKKIISNKEKVVTDYQTFVRKKIFTDDDFWKNHPTERNKLIANIVVDNLSSTEKFDLFFDHTDLCDELKVAINRYNVNNNFRDINSIEKPYHIIDKNKTIIETISIQNNLNSKKRKLFARHKFDENGNGKGKIVIMDSRDGTKPRGWTLRANQKEKTVELINYLLIETKLMNYAKYVNSAHNILKGQFTHGSKNVLNVDLLIELNMIFRFLELKNKTESKWFYEFWESYDYGLMCKS